MKNGHRQKSGKSVLVVLFMISSNLGQARRWQYNISGTSGFKVTQPDNKKQGAQNLTYKWFMNIFPSIVFTSQFVPFDI